MFSFPNPFNKPQKADCTSATGSPSSTLTPDILADCMKLLADPPPPIPKGEYFVSPLVLQALRKETPPAAINPAISEFCGIPVFEMPNQKAQGWLISAPHVAAAYRNGEITEEQLARFYERVQEIRASKENSELSQLRSVDNREC